VSSSIATEDFAPGEAVADRGAGDGNHGLTAHSHIGGRTVRKPPGESHLHPTGSADLAHHPVPSGREEIWRFTPLRRLRGLHDSASLDGDVDVKVSAPGVVEAGVLIGQDAAALKGVSGYLPTDRPAARAWRAAEKTVLIDVPAETVVDEPIEITVHGDTVERAAPAHLVVRLGPFAQATVTLRYTGSATLTDIIEIVVGDTAKLTFVTLAEWEDDAVQLSHHHLKIGRDATVKHVSLAFGGDLVRINASAAYDGPGGDLDLLGLYFADSGQHLEHRLFVDHAVPQCKSRALYKGALQGRKAHTVWVGDVLIRTAAEGTDTYEMNRNLVLTEGARADSVPNLEIETGEIVGAGHASATGRFDDEQLFYLLSRGIPTEVAKRLVVRGFFGEVLLRVGVPAVVERATEIIERELAITGI
jgi:Fe-S cluster assembly protein SufD